MDKKHCNGCYNDFYNYRTNCDGKAECWLLKTAKLQTMYRIGTWTPQDKKENFSKVRKPSCYTQTSFHFYKELPSHLNK